MMSELFHWLKKHAYEAHLLAFGLMTLPSVWLYYSARRDQDILSWGLLAIVIMGNIITLWIR
jgi:hypothetical protein